VAVAFGWRQRQSVSDNHNNTPVHFPVYRSFPGRRFQTHQRPTRPGGCYCLLPSTGRQPSTSHNYSDNDFVALLASDTSNRCARLRLTAVQTATPNCGVDPRRQIAVSVHGARPHRLSDTFTDRSRCRAVADIEPLRPSVDKELPETARRCTCIASETTPSFCQGELRAVGC
jgi:hypothetical protein